MTGSSPWPSRGAAVAVAIDVGAVVDVARTADTTVLTVEGADQAAVRAVMIMLWDCGHEVPTMSTDERDTPRSHSTG